MSDVVRVKPRGIRRVARLHAFGGVTSLIIDVDGTLTDGLMYVDDTGKKVMKAFSSDDSDAIRAARLRGLTVRLVTADKSAAGIVEARARSMDVSILYATGANRILLSYGSVYIGDGWNDGQVFKAAQLGIATANALPRTKRDADVVLSRRGGDKAVAQAIDFVLRWLA